MGNSVGSARNNRMPLSTIGIKDIIDAGQRCAGKIGSTFIPTLQKPMSYTFQKDSGKRDFVNAIQRANSTKLGPNHYKVIDDGGFTTSANLKNVRFAFNKDSKIGVLETLAKKKLWVPAANAYSPVRK